VTELARHSSENGRSTVDLSPAELGGRAKKRVKKVLSSYVDYI
jgi:hypothetical protein